MPISVPLGNARSRPPIHSVAKAIPEGGQNNVTEWPMKASRRPILVITSNNEKEPTKAKTFPVGPTTVTCSATNAAGTTTGTFIVTVLS